MKKLGRQALAFATLAFGVSAIAAAGRAEDPGSPVYGVKLPDGYRDWKLISVAQENGKNNDIRAILGNAIAVKAFRAGTRPFPDGAIIARKMSRGPCDQNWRPYSCGQNA